MRKHIIAILITVSIIALNLIFGNIISWALSIIIIACIAYFVLQVGIEDKVNAVFAKSDVQKNPEIGHQLFQFGKKWESILKFSMLTIVFLATSLGVWRTMQPSGNSPWFLNNDYHGIYNDGIAFDKNLELYPTNDDDANAQLKFSATGPQYNIGFKEFYTPTFKLNEDRKSVLLNKLIQKPIAQSFSIQKDGTIIKVGVLPQEINFFSKLFTDKNDSYQYNISIQSTNQDWLHDFNLTAPFNDEITIEGTYLKSGMLLFDAILNHKAYSSGHEESYLLLEDFLIKLGSTYLLVDYGATEPQLFLFPSKDLANSGAKIWIDEQPTVILSNTQAALHADEDFYIGFNNQKRKLRLAATDQQSYTQVKQANALYFDYPNTFLMRSPGDQKPGNKNIRTITNDFNNIINDDIKEAFYFTTYNLSTKSNINGNIDYISNIPNVPLEVSIRDFNNSSNNIAIENKHFKLQTSDKQYQYLFSIRDFADNGFNAAHTLLYLAITYVLFLILTIGFPSKNLERIEPIILSVIMGLLMVRFILYWRVATFPPLDNISKFELEQTLINFDFNLGFQLPIPLTLIWIILFVGMLIGFRIWSKKNNNNSVKQFLNRFGTTNKAIIKQYALFIGGCLGIYWANKYVLHIEALIRIITIIIPLIGYCYFSQRSNAYYTYQGLVLNKQRINFLDHLRAFLFYFLNNPVLILSIITVVFFCITDRGFAVLFLLFLLLKNIILNFIKTPTHQEKKLSQLLFKPNNFWIYAIIALIVYFAILAYKPLFYYILTYKLSLGLVVLLLGLAAAYLLNYHRFKWFKILAVTTLIYGILIAIPITNQWLDGRLNNVVKHVQYRASIINQPISSLLQDNPYGSFETKKIIETAENQWFINSYISKNYNNNATLNIRPHSRIGVDYPTQTRDVVIARYVISEMGNFVMYTILILTLLPMVFYLMAYQVHITAAERNQRNIGSYGGLIPLLIIFTISLFVWLTATNRFVFFGQDFPFLSLTSKISVLLPLLLFGFTLVQKPTPKHSQVVDIQTNAMKYALFTALIAVFALSTVKTNELSNENFSVVMDTTQHHIDNDLNAILDYIQDGLEVQRKPVTYANVIQALSQDKNFDSLKNEVIKDRYTQSILERLVEKPATAFQLNNPLFMIYDNGRYSAVYNKNLFLELPPVENRNLWQGNIVESIQSTNGCTASYKIAGKSNTVKLPFYSNNPIEKLQIAILPHYWFINTAENIGLVNILNSNNNQSASMYVYKNASKNMTQSGRDYVTTLNSDDLATIYTNNKAYQLGFKSEGQRFAFNKWINGTYKIIYPQRDKNFWMYNFAHAVRNSHSSKGLLHQDVYITIDYNLTQQVYDAVSKASQIHKDHRKYAFSVIGADGNGNVRMMVDYVNNRQQLDPNNEAKIYALQQQQFFYSNAKNERDQWGNRNLLNLYLGPGSSVKPIIAGAISSQVNAGWEHLQTSGNPGLIEHYAGFKPINPWKNTDYLSSYDMPTFIEASSNIYESLLLFLGSYTKNDFGKDGKFSLQHVLSAQKGKNADYPVVQYNGYRMYLPSYTDQKDRWPVTDANAKPITYFGNQNAIIAEGLEHNFNLRTTDKDKNDGSAYSTDRVNYVDSTLFARFNQNKSSSYLWSFPEESYFLQSDRAHSERYQNFNMGLKTPTLGGYPMKITPFKMNEMYLSLFSQNSNLRLSIINDKKAIQSWKVDQSWGNNSAYRKFLAQQIITGMERVIYGGSGTLKTFAYLRSKYPQYHFYAKTGTINEEGSGQRSSKRLVIIIADKDMTQAENIGNAKTYALYFTSDQTQSFDYDLLKSIVDQTVQSKSFKTYFN